MYLSILKTYRYRTCRNGLFSSSSSGQRYSRSTCSSFPSMSSCVTEPIHSCSRYLFTGTSPTSSPFSSASSSVSSISPYLPLRYRLVHYFHSIILQEFPFMNISLSSPHQMDRYVAIASPRTGPTIDYQINAAILIAKQSSNQYTPLQVAEILIQKFSDIYGTTILPCTLTLPEREGGQTTKGTDGKPIEHEKKKKGTKSSTNHTVTNTSVGNIKGFVNVSISDTWLIHQAKLFFQQSTSSTVSVPTSSKVLIDFGSPNMGKELHVGHLRSAVVGDTLARILESSLTNKIVQSMTESSSSKVNDKVRTNTMIQVDRISHVGDCGLPVALVLTEYLQSSVYQKRQQEYTDILRKRSSVPVTDIYASLSRFSSDIHKFTTSLPSPSELSKMYETAKRLSTNSSEYSQKTQEILRSLQSTLSGTMPLSNLNEALLQQYPLLLPWLDICEASRLGYLPLFQRLNVHVKEYGESNYAPYLSQTVEQLQQSKLAVEDDGAIVIFTTNSKENNNPKPTEPPVLIRKRDGGYLYATIDLATIKLRLSQGYERIIYVTDAAQSSHFQQIFKVALLAGWIEPLDATKLHTNPLLSNLALDTTHDNTVVGLNKLTNPPSPVVLEHASFGVVTGEGGKKLSSRDGTDLTLLSLLDNGMNTVYGTMQKNQESVNKVGGSATTGTSPAPVWIPPIAQQNKLSANELSSISEAISTSSIRFFDLFHRRNSNYSFSYEKALTLKGNTAPYVQYAVTRLRTMRKTLGKSLQLVPKDSKKVVEWQDLINFCDNRIRILSNDGKKSSTFTNVVHQPVPSERLLALAIVRLPETLYSVYKTLMPHILAETMVNLAGYVHTYYDEARVFPTVITDELMKDPYFNNIELWSIAKNRLELFQTADVTLRQCFSFLGIQIVDRM